MDKGRMLERLGFSSAEELFADVPSDVRTKLDIGNGLSEMDTVAKISDMLKKNTTSADVPCFMGMGAYRHYVPATVDHVTGISEFYTSYTPYQPEISQGMLQALFEYQSVICELTGMDASNSSMYDGATALGEAARMCSRMAKGKTFVIPEALSSDKRSVLRNYLIGTDIRTRTYGFDKRTGSLLLEDISDAVNKGDVCGVYAEMPNLFGCLDKNVASIRSKIGDVPLVIGVNPMCLPIVRPPGEIGADIAIGEGQPMGTRLGYGSPLLGMFACRQEHIRKMPGRVVGMTSDADGRTAFCLTLQTREQHIRRSSATSNICTNEALTAVAAAVYAITMGAKGMIDNAKKNMERSKTLMSMLSKVKGVGSVFDNVHFNEFVIRLSKDPKKVNSELLKKGVIGGVPMKGHVKGMDDCMLVTTTEMHSDEDHKKFVGALKEVL
ncbi:MAG: aminomethyl-transferring glycine dehydrogenase subunit GcvPA [Methanomassiliicoccaceae archaeon]|nr:aminomethyl-transferring glycine dehydrogenase subunit GcvPA [Methanomassiliicoccaceae archaeon]